jgi:outer membrane lipoprotein-sorting protein
VRVKLNYVLLPIAAGAVIIAAALFVPCVKAQNPDNMMPEQSEARGKQILRDLIAGLGGPGYTEVRESECSGLRALFGHSGDLTGYINFTDFRQYPDKARIEYSRKGRNTILLSLIGLDGLDFAHGGIVIALYNGDRAWSYDRSGVSELPVTSVTDFQEAAKRSVDNLLRFRLKEPGVSIRFGGNDTVDLRQVDWVEINDSEGRKYRLAVNRSTHLLDRVVVSTEDTENQQVNDDTTIYSNYQLKDSAWTPMQFSREHNGRRTAQFFLDSCRYNPGFPQDLFSKDSLKTRGAELVSKKK